MFNDPVNPMFALAIFCVAFAFGSLLSKLSPEPKASARVSSLDGLRGVLVLAVFIAHSSVWYFYVKTGMWALPPSNLFGNLGQASVALFFMITGYLFFLKILKGGGEAIDWAQIYISRVLRLTPLYLVTILIVCAVVAINSDFTFVEPPAAVAREIINWLTFGISGMPDINLLNGTAKIISFVIWTLPYEWIFYLALPLLALLTGAKINKTVICLSTLVLILVIWRMGIPGPTQLSIFLGGIVAALCDRFLHARRFCAGNVASIVAAICLIWALCGFSTAYAAAPILLLSVSFIIFACGNSFFGLLLHPSLRVIGDAGYSVYLLHGIILYVTFNTFVGSGSDLLESPRIFWGIIAALTVPLLSFCYFTFRFVEAPAMNSVGKVRLMVSSVIGPKAGNVRVKNSEPRTN